MTADRGRGYSKPSVKQHLAAIRMLFDYLVTGGAWGLRLKDVSAAGEWSLKDPEQWGEPFLLVPVDGERVRFA